VIGNTVHELKNIRVEAELYGDVTVSTTTMKVPAGEVLYDAASKKLVWTVPNMPTTVDVLALQIPVVLTAKNPTQTHLSSKASFRATDAVSGQDIFLSGDALPLE
jgi:hypothetical protein